MNDAIRTSVLANIIARKAVTAEDVLALRGQFYRDADISIDEARALIDADEAITSPSAEWSAFFVEAITDHLVWREAPHGYVSEANAAWLIDAVSRDGTVKTASELALLVGVLKAAKSSPASLSAFALRQVAVAVLDGEGPLARGGSLRRGVIGRAEVELLRDILYAFGGQDAIGISREEAEVLFDLNDRSTESENDPAWSDLFVKAVANFLMAARGYVVPPREEALRREAWLDSPTGGIPAFFSGMMGGLLTNGLKNIWSSFREGESEQAVRNRTAESEIRVAEAVTSEEVRWLAERIGRDGVLHENERALLNFLQEESQDLHPSLRTLLDTAA